MKKMTMNYQETGYATEPLYQQQCNVVCVELVRKIQENSAVRETIRMKIDANVKQIGGH